MTIPQFSGAAMRARTEAVNGLVPAFLVAPQLLPWRVPNV